MVRGLARRRINPNVLTVIGVSINVVSGLLFGLGHFFWAGVILIVANLFDMLDGQVARRTGQVTRFGGFLDSTLDRVSDMAAFVGLMTFYARDTELHSTLNVLLAGLALVGSVLVSYASARAESLFANRMPAVLWILCVGSFWTFAYRVYHTWKELNRVAEPAAATQQLEA